MENTEKEQIKKNKTQRKLDGAESMVIINIKDGDGKTIENARINDYKYYPHEEYEIVIDSYHIFSRDELLLILNLIEKRVEYGGDVPTTKQYLDLYDKIEKMVYQNDCK